MEAVRGRTFVPDLQRNKETVTAYCDLAFVWLRPRTPNECYAGGGYMRSVLQIASQSSANPNGML